MKILLIVMVAFELSGFGEAGPLPGPCKVEARVRCVDARNQSGWPGRALDAWLAAAAKDLPQGGAIRVAAGSYILPGQLHLASNIRYEFDPAAVVSVSPSFMGKVAVDLTGLTNVELIGGVFDGNRENISAAMDGLYVIRSNRVTISNTVIRNFRGNGINLTFGDAFITIRNSDIYNNGAPLPAAEGWGISVSPAKGTLTHVQIGPGNQVHDNNGGLVVTNSATAENAVEDVKVIANRFHHNANDGASFTAFHDDGGVIENLHVENNESDCNGWPGKGQGFPPNCLPAGFLQGGASDSSGGSGFDFIQNGDALLMNSDAVENKAHDNAYDGFDATYNPSVLVNVSGTWVDWISGPRFKAWKQGQPVLMNGVVYEIARCVSARRCELKSSAGNLTRVAFQGPGVMSLTFLRNSAVHNGNRNIPPNVGAGFYSQFADGVRYRENESRDNNLEGFDLYYCNFTSFHGDRAYGNNTGNTPGRNIGFSVVGGLDNSFEAISAGDTTASPRQTIGVRISPHATHTVIRSSTITGSSRDVEDLGASTVLDRSAPAPHP